MRMICQICNEYIGLVDIEAFQLIEGATGKLEEIQPLRYPFRGSMVGSPDSTHSVPPPFHRDIDYEAARCPYGRIHRPMIHDDLIKTYKGMVRLPKDGSKAFLDPSVTGDVDRDRLGDQTQQVPVDVAERMARELLSTVEVPKDTIIVINRDHIVIENTEPIPPLYVYEVKVDPEKSGWICVTCGKQFDKQKSLQGHLMSHKKKPKPPPKKAPVRKKGRKR